MYRGGGGVSLSPENKREMEKDEGRQRREDALAVTARDDGPRDVRSALGLDEHRNHTTRLDREDRVVECPKRRLCRVERSACQHEEKTKSDEEKEETNADDTRVAGNVDESRVVRRKEVVEDLLHPDRLLGRSLLEVRRPLHRKTINTSMCRVSLSSRPKG